MPEVWEKFGRCGYFSETPVELWMQYETEAPHQIVMFQLRGDFLNAHCDLTIHDLVKDNTATVKKKTFIEGADTLTNLPIPGNMKKQCQLYEEDGKLRRPPTLRVYCHVHRRVF